MPLRTANGTVYERFGPKAAPTIVFLHGLGLNRHAWQWQIPVLATDYQAVCYDLFGHGQSADPPAPPSLQLFSTQLADLLDHCGLAQVALVGFSLGGMIARRFVQDHPDRAVAMAVLHSPHTRSAAAQAAIMARVQAARLAGPAATVEAALERWFTEPYRVANPQQMDLVRGWVTANAPAIYHQIYQVLADGVAEIVAPEPALRLPTLVITGDEDFGNGPKMAAAIADEIAGAQLLILKGLRHMALAEDPAAIYQPLRAFFRQVFNGDDGDSTSGRL